MLRVLFKGAPLLSVLTVAVGLLSGATAAALVWLIRLNANGPSRPAAFALMFLGLCGAHFCTGVVSEVILQRLAQDHIYRLRLELCRKILALPYKRLEQLGKARLFVLLTADIDSLRQAALYFPGLFGNLVIMLVCVGLLFYVSPAMGLCLCLCSLASAAVYFWAERSPLRKIRAVREQMDDLHIHLRSLIDGLKELQLNESRADYFADSILGRSAREARRRVISASASISVVSNIGNTLFFLTIGLTVFVVPLFLQVSRADVTSVSFLLLFLVQPISAIVTGVPTLRQAAVALGKIRQFDADLTPERVGRTSPAEDPFAAEARGSDGTLLRLHQVCHRFPSPGEDRPFTLGPIDLTIKANEIVFIVGGNGSGKTTLGLLLLGFYEPDSGRIELKGTARTVENLPFYRRHFSAVFSDFCLFETVFSAGREDVERQANTFIQRLDISHKVRVAHGRFTTTDLSLGQRKRMALVSSLLEDRPIILFDEWAADQDPEFKRVFYTEILPELKQRGKTVLVVSHDDSYFAWADRVIKLQDGLAVTADDRGAPLV